MSRPIKRVLAGLSPTEVSTALDGVTAGAAAAGKAVVLDSSKGISTINSATIINLDVGASGSAGAVDVFPATASKGKLAISCTDQAGNTTVDLVAGAMAAARTITIPDPGANANVLTSEGIGGRKIARQSADVTATTNVTLADLTGLSLTVIAGATYKFRVALQCLSTANGGTKVGFKLTTATLTSLQSENKAFTASAVAVTRVTTATDEASQVAATAANICIELEGTIVVNAAGTITVRGAQNASHADTTTFYTGSTFELTRIA